MIYSVWNHAERRYDYYQTGEKSAKVNAPTPKHLSGAHELGMTPEEAAWPLPMGAKLVGSGKIPKGMIAERGGQSLGFFELRNPVHALLLGGLGLALFMEWKKRKRR